MTRPATGRARLDGWDHGCRYLGGGVFEVSWLVGACFLDGGGFLWPRRYARAVGRAAAVRFVRKWGLRPHAALAYDLGLRADPVPARVRQGFATLELGPL